MLDQGLNEREVQTDREVIKEKRRNRKKKKSRLNSALKQDGSNESYPRALAEVKIRGKKASALLDTGADNNFILFHLVELLKLRVYPVTSNVQGADTKAIRTFGTVEVDIQIESQTH